MSILLLITRGILVDVAVKGNPCTLGIRGTRNEIHWKLDSFIYVLKTALVLVGENKMATSRLKCSQGWPDNYCEDLDASFTT